VYVPYYLVYYIHIQNSFMDLLTSLQKIKAEAPELEIPQEASGKTRSWVYGSILLELVPRPDECQLQIGRNCSSHFREIIADYFQFRDVNASYSGKPSAAVLVNGLRSTIQALKLLHEFDEESIKGLAKGHGTDLVARLIEKHCSGLSFPRISGSGTNSKNQRFAHGEFLGIRHEGKYRAVKSSVYRATFGYEKFNTAKVRTFLRDYFAKYGFTSLSNDLTKGGLHYDFKTFEEILNLYSYVEEAVQNIPEDIEKTPGFFSNTAYDGHDEKSFTSSLATAHVLEHRIIPGWGSNVKGQRSCTGPDGNQKYTDLVEYMKGRRVRIGECAESPDKGKFLDLPHAERGFMYCNTPEFKGRVDELMFVGHGFDGDALEYIKEQALYCEFDVKLYTLGKDGKHVTFIPFAY